MTSPSPSGAIRPSRAPTAVAVGHDGRDQLLITGIYAHIGCMLTARTPSCTMCRRSLITDGVADFNSGYHAGAIDYVNSTCGVSATADEALRALQS